MKSLEGAIAAKQFQAEQDTAWLDRANMFKTRLLAILPPVFRKEGEIFLNRFIMENLNEDYKEISIPGASRRPVPGANYMPGAHPQKQGFPLKVKTLFYQQQLQNSAMNLTRQTMSTGNTTPALTLPARQKR